MNVSLTPALESFVDRKVKTGMYQTASEVIREALRLLSDRDAQLDQLRREIRAGFADVDAGRYSEYDDQTTTELARQVKARGRRRLANRLKKTRIG